jgi:hypothetical protein
MQPGLKALSIPASKSYIVVVSRTRENLMLGSTIRDTQQKCPRTFTGAGTFQRQSV